MEYELKPAPPLPRQNDTPAAAVEAAELGAYEAAFGVHLGGGALAIPEVMVPTKPPYEEYVKNMLSRALGLPDEREFTDGEDVALVGLSNQYQIPIYTENIHVF